MNIYGAITMLALIVVCVCALLMLTPLNDLLKRKMNETSYNTLTEICDIATMWAEQWLCTKTGAEKKAEAIAYVERKCKEYNIDVSAEDIDKGIEAGVKKLRG